MAAPSSLTANSQHDSSNRQSNRSLPQLDLLRCIAIASVICAHTAYVPENASTSTRVASSILKSLGVIGVPLFFIISGYLYRPRRPFADFLTTTIERLLVPWLSIETLLWLFIVLRKGGASIASWASWLIGWGHSTYFLTVLLIFFIVFRNETVLRRTPLIAAISLFFICFVPPDAPIPIAPTPYLNPLNWVLYFMIGMAICKTDSLDSLNRLCRENLLTVFGLWFGLLLNACYLREIPYRYWGPDSFIWIMVSFLLALGLTSLPNSNLSAFPLQIGRLSFTIFLTHEFFVGAIVRVTNLSPNSLLVSLRPFITLFLIAIFTILIDLILKGGKFRHLRLFLGLR